MAGVGVFGRCPIEPSAEDNRTSAGPLDSETGRASTARRAVDKWTFEPDERERRRPGSPPQPAEINGALSLRRFSIQTVCEVFVFEAVQAVFQRRQDPGTVSLNKRIRVKP